MATTQNTIKFSILITTKNRISDLLFTLTKTASLLNRKDVECILCDDGSNDGTSAIISTQFPEISFIRNERSIGLIGSRNRLLSMAKGLYAISIDDDLHFLSGNVLENIDYFFSKYPKCGVIGFRIFWGLTPPLSIDCNEKPERVKSYVGCGHVFRLKAWNDIPNYPYWFIFYGEEDFASYHLFKMNWEIHYVPDILVHHRVNLTSRRKDKDYFTRMRRSLRSGWYLMLLFYPLNLIPRRWSYSLWIQIKKRTLKGNLPATLAMLIAFVDVILHLPRISKESNRLSTDEFKSFQKLPDAKIYWKP